MNKKFFLFFCSLCVGLVLGAQTNIKMMSFNIRLDVASDGENRWELRKDKVAGLINYYEPDFVGGQEVQHQQLQYLLQNLNGYQQIGVARDDGNTEGEYSCIFYKKDKYKLLLQKTFWLSPTPDSVSFGWDAACRRVCTYGLFQHKKTKQKIWVFNTHFDHVSAQARLESAKLIIKKINEVNAKNYPVILSGDFNSKPTEDPAQYMFANMNNASTESKLVYGNPDTWNGFKFQQKPEGCIDYIFVSRNKKISVKKFATLTDSYEMKYPSDHFPIMAEMEIK
ncbi:MAG TPA: endonuclease/exonuclease/phosphatase family protein [Ferruginibacter sp.]|nr:endonuclease/exonuclease/phosphatase family protein [Ferruginibacter sp.]HRE62627.1 endonuclease/exonuclease/phosphatase family protein [Ferruginibacter sp.]